VRRNIAVEVTMLEPGHEKARLMRTLPEPIADVIFWGLAAVGVIVAVHPIHAEPTQTAAPAAAYDEAIATAMTRMMAEMHLKPTGDVDRDFLAMMIPHHQGAIDMAIAELRFGRDPHVRRIAQEIIVEQLQEIAAMRSARENKK
jgi:uncharacterized protein (DUF305 family)